MSRYKDIAKNIQDRIQSGEYKPNQILPSQKDLATEFQTSRVTIQKSLDELSNKNLIIRKQGSGSFVAPNPLSTLDILSSQYEGTTQLFRDKGTITTKVLRFDIRLPQKKEAERLNISDTTPVYDVFRLRNLNDEPYELDQSIMPLSVITDLTEQIAKGSIYNFIENNLGLKVGSSTRKISAKKPNDDDIKYLDCKNNDPVLQVSQTVSLTDGRIFEYSHTKHRYDKGSIIVVNNIEK
ncbi:GntR family transcriptional regulator [Companilactobacillus allii]|uniref:GntR family transcriptional regulator n=1 Tax=Companilactobacillus allii TaxID=1847728 RepID=A0A1P8Q116_9LACO|nr:GntR family transcriptional regulator [Companilactobacillus allii]